MNLNDMPIRRKLMLIILLTSIVVMLLMRGAFFTYEYLTFRHALVRQISSLGDILAANSTAALAFDNQDDAREILAALAAERNIVAAALYDETGLFARYPADLPADRLPSLPGPAGPHFGDGALVSYHPVVEDERRLGTLYLKLDSGTLLKEFIRGSAHIALAVMAAVLLIAYLLSRALQKQISEPILALAGTARAVAERGDYSVRAAKAGGGELGLLTGAFNQMLGQIQDLTRDLEQRVIQRTAQLEAANKELEAFSYSVSHDLRAPLRHIDGFAGLLAKSDSATLSERGRRHLGHIAGSAKQMGALIDDLLVFSRMGRTEMRVAPVDLNVLVEETIRTLQPECQHRNIEWRTSPLPVVQGDGPMLRQVLVNLIANAIKYSRPRDPAVIEIASREEPSGEIIVHVRDNGVGFEMQYADKLFGVFQRLHRAEDFEGTGIGLANVRRIILRHGGRTWAESRPGAGATFYFSLSTPGKAAP